MALTLVLLVAIGAGLWWSNTQAEINARASAIDLVWADVETAYRPRLLAIPALSRNLVVPEAAALVAELRRAFDDLPGPNATTDARAIYLSRVEGRERELIQAGKANPAIGATSAYKVFSLDYSSVSLSVDRAVTSYNTTVARYSSLATVLPGRLIGGLRDTHREYFDPR